MEENVIFCRQCEILNNLPKDVLDYTQKLYRLLDEKDRATDSLISQRLKVCETCEKNREGTCQSCGCYVAFRAMKKEGNCPMKKW
ncbi:MAG: DUF6171 family protein [Lachnospiraceae bacterium]|nr:DUF6171 family protein [Lachnospiraceae bacterium]